MNSNQINQLKKVLRKYGIRNSENTVRSEIDLNYSKFLELAEPIYVVSRIQSCYKGDREKDLLKKANIEWIKTVIDNGWCSHLAPYIQKYGTSITEKAIVYLIEKDIWDSYRGKDYLKMKAPDHYKGFGDIDAAAEFVKEQMQCVEEVQDDNPVIEQTDPVKDDTREETANDHPDAAYEACQRIFDKFNSMSEDFAVVKDFIVMNCENNEYRKTMDELKSRIEVLQSVKDRLESELAEKRNCINDLQLTIAGKNDELTELENKCTSMSAEQLGFIRRNEELQDKVFDLESVLKELKKESESIRDEKPKKKVIPESGLRELPLVGDKMLRGLAPFLEKYNIIIDPTK